MNIDQAKERIRYYEWFIDLVEGYEADTFEKKAIKYYVLVESVNNVADALNEEEHRIGNRKVAGKDVSDIIRGKPTDPLHEEAKKMFGKNRRRASTHW